MKTFGHYVVAFLLGAAGGGSGIGYVAYVYGKKIGAAVSAVQGAVQATTQAVKQA